jgi:hypothetical protein
MRFDPSRQGRYASPVRNTVSSKGQVTVPIEAGSHPVDKVWGTLSLGRPVDEILDEMRGPRRLGEAPLAGAGP